MSEIKEAYKKGLVSEISNRPVLTTLIVVGAGYYLFKKFKSTIDELVQEGRQSSADTSSSGSNVSPFNWSAYFNYWKPRLPKGYKILTQASINDIATKIYDAMGYFYDNEDVIKGQFKRINSKVKIAQLAEAFSKKYKSDLYTFIKDGVGVRWNSGLDEENLNSILKYIDGLPNYTK